MRRLGHELYADIRDLARGSQRTRVESYCTIRQERVDSARDAGECTAEAGGTPVTGPH
jgi:hypothetical protein